MPGKAFEIKGLDKVVKLFNDIEDRMIDATPVNKKIGARGFKNVMKHFSEEKGENGQKWPQWKKGGKRFSTRPFGRGGSSLLQDTGAMKNKFRFKGLKNSAVIFIVDNVYRYHHKGTSKMDQRKALWVDDKTINSMANDLAKYLVRG